MKKRLQLGLLYLGALALSLTLATAEGKCGDKEKGMKETTEKCQASQKGMKGSSGKCGDEQKDMMDNEGKCNASKKPKPAPTKGKCGQGKCG